MQKHLIVDPLRPSPETIAQAVEALGRGELIVLPTETVYGVGVDPRVPGAVERIFAAKGRPSEKQIPLLAADLGQVRAAGAALGGVALRLAEAFWPGPLTLVLPTPDGWRGFRVPDHGVALAVLQAAGSVLAVTSANRSGEAPALEAGDAARALGDAVALVLDAGRSPGGTPSTVVKVVDQKVEILREGAIAGDDIKEMVNG